MLCVSYVFDVCCVYLCVSLVVSFCASYVLFGVLCLLIVA